MRYPSTAESAERAAALAPGEVDRLQVIRYGREHWDAARIESEMKQASEWARRRGVPLVCNEFGVYREYSDPLDRDVWLHDVRTALERNGIGWAMWDYSGSFGLVMKKDGKTVADEGVLPGAGDEVSLNLPKSKRPNSSTSVLTSSESLEAVQRLRSSFSCAH